MHRISSSEYEEGLSGAHKRARNGGSVFESSSFTYSFKPLKAGFLSVGSIIEASSSAYPSIPRLVAIAYTGFIKETKYRLLIKVNSSM
jgi:hypothetical protein